MPTRNDKLFQKQKTSKKLRRRAAKIEPAHRVLIVTEGEVTEVEYFNDLKNTLRLVNVDLDICGKECNSSPTAVVRFALERSAAEGPHNKGGYNDVYCVFDRDDHQDFEKAVSQILTANKPRSSFGGENIEAIVSYPCFEYWLLLHFVYSRAPFVAVRGKTAAELVVSKLKEYPPFLSFEKSLTEEMIAALRDNTGNAIGNASKSLIDANTTADLNPSTTVHRLVVKLQSMAK